MEPPEPPRFGALLRAYRLQADLTQEALAERAGLSVRGIQAWESGAARPHRETVTRLARALRLSSDERARFESFAPAAPRRRTPGLGAGLPLASSRSDPLATSSEAAVDNPPRPAASPPTIDGGLPVALTSFVGRERELSDVERLLHTARLVTLIGPGGVGKTRLALQVAAFARERWGRKVVFVPLSLVASGELVVSAIAQSLGLKEGADKDLEAQLRTTLRDQHLLLVLDNFEHVLTAAPTVSALLSSCPHLSVLVTSRVGLNVYGDQQYPVSALSLPPLLDEVPAAANGSSGAMALIEASDAARLFVIRAQAARPDFRLTPDNATTIAAICRRVDGLPLAIELAAARVRLFPPASLLSRLTDSFQVLTGGPADRPDRQRAMRTAIAWSYDLLGDQEQRVFRRLSVFAGGFNWEAAEAVATALDGAGDILSGLDALVSQSLLIQDAIDEAPRFRMLGLLREYGLERLTEAGEVGAAREAHARFYADLVDEACPKLRGPSQEIWLARLEREHDNLRAALRWLIERRDADRALRLVGGLPRFWWLHGHLTEGRAQCDAALSLGLDGATEEARARALAALGQLAVCQYDFSAARPALEATLAIYRRVGNVAGVAAALNWLGNGALCAGDYAAARSYYEESLELQRGLGSSGDLGNVLNNLGILAYYDGDYQRARERYQESLDWNRKTGDLRDISMCLGNLAEVAHKLGEDATALGLFVESIRIKQRLGELPSKIVVVEGLAAVFATSGTSESAVLLVAAANAARDRLKLPLSAADQADLDRTLDRCRERLGAPSFAIAWSEGEALTLDQVIARVLGEMESC